MRLIASPAIRAGLLSALVLAAGVSPALAAAQHSASGTPSRIDNNWDWRSHQPTEAEVRSREPDNPAAQRAADAEVNQLYQQLMSPSAG